MYTSPRHIAAYCFGFIEHRQSGGFLYCLTLVVLLTAWVKGVSVYVRTNQQPQIMRQNLNVFLTFRTIHHILLHF